MPVKGTPKQIMGTEMHKFKHGTLHSGSSQGPKVKSRDQAIAISLSEAREHGKGGKMPKAYPGGGGPDPTNHDKVGHEIVNTRAGDFHGGVMGQKMGRSTAAADVALPHMAHGAQRDSGFNEGLPPMAQAPDRGPPKHGSYPAPLGPSQSHGYGHSPSQRHGHLRMSGHLSAHQLGKRK